MDLYREVGSCRICGNEQLDSILHLGEQALTGIFPRGRDSVPSGPLELIKCDERSGGCGLVQLRHSYQPDQMYGQNYGYRSGLNRSMVEHLGQRVRKAMAIAKPTSGDLILDIGSNDSTTLRAYPDQGLTLVGMDPTGTKFSRYYPPHVQLIPDFFNAQTFTKNFPGRKAKIVTSIAMFYDLENPQDFMSQIHQILADDGIWVFEQSYCPAMLAVNAYDTICHEHVSYYALRQIKWMADRVGLKILAVELNDVNGGSFCVTVAKKNAPYIAADKVVADLISDEDRAGFSTLMPFYAFRERVEHQRNELTQMLKDLRRQGKKVYGYGASTKGNVVLQYCNLTVDDIPAIAEVNEDKFGAFTPGTNIPILSEQEVHALQPDYLLVLPWHFRDHIIGREQPYLNRGGKLLFPLPSVDAVSSARKAVAA